MKERDLISKELAAAREYETKQSALVAEDERPVYHFTPRIGWLNDPNGLSYYDGQYHLFYQYHPYSSYWGPMHWGHAVSEDMIQWTYLPAALAPDSLYDHCGCFSGTALPMDDGSHLLMYTGCTDDFEDPTGRGRWLQSQNVAIKTADDSEYHKYSANPVITFEDLPEGADPYEFRDPYLWRMSDGTYRTLVALGMSDETAGTRLIMYRSDDGLHWSCGKTLFEDSRRIGVMWECPNFFPLGEQYILIASPMDMQAEEEEAVGTIRFPKGNNVCYITGQFDEDTEEFIPTKRYEPVDCGLDFYAPQVMETPDHRRVMIGWMQDPHTANLHEQDIRIFGQMTVPRKLEVKDGRLYQWPVREFDRLRKDEVHHQQIKAEDETIRIPDIMGRSVDLLVNITQMDACRQLSIRFAEDQTHAVELRYEPERSVMTIDRSRSGQQKEMTGERTVTILQHGESMALRILIDQWSAEIFVNGGEKVMSLTYYTDLSAQGISFSAKGKAVFDITQYTISLE